MTSSRFAPIVCAMLTVSFETTAFAQVAPAEPPPAEPPPAALTQAEPPPVAPAAPASAAPIAPPPPQGVFEPAPLAAIETQLLVMHAHARHARRSRIVGSVAMLVTGATSVGAGLLADLEYDQPYGKVLWIGGAAIGVSGLLGLFKSSAMESFEAEASTMSPTALRVNWAALANSARRSRQISGGVFTLLGVAVAGVGGLIAAGVGDFDRNDKQTWSIALLSVGGALFGSGLSSLLIDSDIELGYRAAYGSDPNQFRISLGVTPTLGGAAGGVSARW